MTTQYPVVNGESELGVEPERVYISCSPEDLITVEMDAWRRGYDAADADTKAAERLLPDIERQGEEAYEVALCRYVPMNLEQFHDVYVRGWCTGYGIRLRELGLWRSA